MPQTDTYKLVASLLVAIFLVIGGIGILAYAFLSGTVDADTRAQLAALLGPFVGFGINFLFQTNTNAAARAQTRNDLLTSTSTTTLTSGRSDEGVG